MRRALLGVALLVAALVPALAGGPARAASIGQCTTTRGTIVAVDFGHWGGPVVRGCGVQASGQPDPTGYVLLHDGGFTTAGDNHDGPAFICRLGNAAYSGGTQYPTPAQDPCAVTPPASAYWSYWLAGPGADSWHYSDEGAASEHPVAGEIELWEFGATGVSGTSGSGVPPDSLIAQLRATNATAAGSTASVTPKSTPTPSAAAPKPAGSGSGGTSRGPASPGRGTGTVGTGTSLPSEITVSGHGAGTSAAASRAPHPSGSPTSSGPSNAATAAGGGSGGGPQILTASATPPARHGSGSVVPVALTVVLVALLGAGGGASLWRRRRPGQD